MFKSVKRSTVSLKGRIFSKIEGLEKDSDFVRFHCAEEDGAVFEMYHNQDCCESVYLQDIIGDAQDLLFSPIIKFECVTNADEPEGITLTDRDVSETWTFYKFQTLRGSVTPRWYGGSNGYYSEKVDFKQRVDGCSQYEWNVVEGCEE